MNAMDVQSMDIASFGFEKSASGGEMRISKSPRLESVANPANPGSVRICESDLEPSQKKRKLVFIFLSFLMALRAGVSAIPKKKAFLLCFLSEYVL
jgi:hypothetical protein